MWATSGGLSLKFLFLVVLGFLSAAAECPSYREYFSKCKLTSPNFDGCLVKQLNKMKHCYLQGEPSLGIPVLEPVRYGELSGPVTTTLRSGNLFNCEVTVTNLTEWGWPNSTYTKVKTDFKKRMVQIWQTIPMKRVMSDVISDHGQIMGVPYTNRSGTFLLEMTGVKERFTFQMLPNGRLKVNLIVLAVNDMVLESRGLILDDVAEKLTNSFMRRFWRLGYGYFRRFGYEASDNAKTVLFNKLFTQIDWEGLFGQSFSGLPKTT